jgi:hypothetical protein
MEDYRIQYRKGSSNIIEKKVLGENGKYKYIPFIAPLIRKEEGDIIVQQLIDLL